jgi:hypothetical protein
MFDTGSCGWYARRLDAVCVRLRLQEYGAHGVQESLDGNDEEMTISLSIYIYIYIYIYILSLSVKHREKKRGERKTETETGRRRERGQK